MKASAKAWGRHPACRSDREAVSASTEANLPASVIVLDRIVRSVIRPVPQRLTVQESQAVRLTASAIPILHRPLTVILPDQLPEPERVGEPGTM